MSPFCRTRDCGAGDGNRQEGTACAAAGDVIIDFSIRSLAHDRAVNSDSGGNRPNLLCEASQRDLRDLNGFHW